MHLSRSARVVLECPCEHFRERCPDLEQALQRSAAIIHCMHTDEPVGTCAANGCNAISGVYECQTAATALGVAYYGTASFYDVPPGCVWCLLCGTSYE